MTSSPDLQPIRDAFKQADLIAEESAPAIDTAAQPTVSASEGDDAAHRAGVRDAVGKKRRKKTEREHDAESIRLAFARGGEVMAYKVGRAYKWSDTAIAKAIAPPPPPEVADAPRTTLGDASAGGGEAGADGSSAGGSGGAWTPAKDPVKALPPDCPVKPLGVSGNTFFYLDPLNELRDLADKDHSAMGLRGLFKHRIDALWQFWPKFSAATGNQDGWKADRAAETLMTAAGARGVYDAFTRVRGLGAWTDEDGGLVLHAGDGVLCGGAWHPPGEHGQYLYPAYNAAPRPAGESSGYVALFDELLRRLDGWNWQGERGDAGDMLQPDAFGHMLSSILVFGWLGTAIVGGALAWRSLLWLTGDAGSGKSTLLQLIEAVIGDAVRSAEATPAGVYQTLKNSTRAVLLDEVENDPDSPRTANLVKLARKASSGDMILRGSSDHQAAAFNCRSSFLFSSIIIPPMHSQDLTRFAVLDIGPVRGDAPTYKLDPVKADAAGRMIRRRIVDNWHRWPDVLAAWRLSLADVGHSSRGCDQFGGLLAMADLLLADDVAYSDVRAEICEHFRTHADEARAAASSNAGTMLNYLITLPIDAFRGGNKVTVGELINGATLGDDDKGIGTPKSCEDALRTYGIFVQRDTTIGFQWRVTLPNQHEGLRRLFESSQWRSAPGTAGGWSQAMKRLDRAQPVNSRALGGRGWAVPVDTFLLREKSNG